MYQQLTICQFKKSEIIRGGNGTYFRLEHNARCLRYKIFSDSRKRVMKEACRMLENKIRMNGEARYANGIFVKCFKDWFISLTKTSRYSFDNDLEKFESAFITEFSEILNKFKVVKSKKPNNKSATANSSETTQRKDQKHSGNLKAGDILYKVEPTTPEEFYREEIIGMKNANDDIPEDRYIFLYLKESKVRVHFDKQPTLEDIEMLSTYLKYKLL